MKDANQQMEKVTQNLMQACDDVHANCSKSVDAIVEASTVVAKGCEEFNRKIGELMQESVARAMSTSKTMFGTRNLQDFARLQAEFMKESMDLWMAGAGHLSEISTRTTQEAIQPVTRQANETMTQTAERMQQQNRAA